MKIFKIGDHVTAIDEAVSGIVCEIKDLEVFITTSDGLKLAFLATELMEEKALNSDEIVTKDIAAVIKEKEELKTPKSVKVKPKERNLPKMEVDLHIHQITTKHKHLSNFAILNMQLDTARYKLEFAIKKRIQKIVFIHGVGDGVLKSELEYLLKRYDQINFYPADYQKYGEGATEVYIKQH